MTIIHPEAINIGKDNISKISVDVWELKEENGDYQKWYVSDESEDPKDLVRWDQYTADDKTLG